MPLGLIALALGGFGIGLTEFVIMGLLPEVAADFSVSEAAAGWLISGYALAVVVGALALTAAVTRLPKKPVLLALMVLFIAGNLVSALAGDYQVMLAGRILAALSHGAFFGIGSVLAAAMVPAHRQAGAIAIMFTGLTAANVLGVPFGTLLGQHFGWRSTFWAITVIGVIAFIGILTLVPKPKRDGAPASLLAELRAFRSGQVWLSIAVTVLGYGGMFGAFTYIAYTLTEVSGFASTTVPWLLILFGVGLLVGNIVGGKAADRNIDRTLIVDRGADRHPGHLRRDRAVARSHRDRPRPHGWLRIRDRARPADAGDAVRVGCSHARLGSEHRRVQPRQRGRRLARWRHDHRGSRLHLADLGRCGHHPARADRHHRRVERRETRPPSSTTPAG